MRDRPLIELRVDLRNRLEIRKPRRVTSDAAFRCSRKTNAFIAHDFCEIGHTHFKSNARGSECCKTSALHAKVHFAEIDAMRKLFFGNRKQRAQIAR